MNERGHNDRDFKTEIERQQKIGKELNCKFVRIDPSRENFSTFNELCNIKNYTDKFVKKSSKIKTIDYISDVLPNLEFKENNTIKTKLLKWIVKRILPKI